jgi:hypothetical protein
LHDGFLVVKNCIDEKTKEFAMFEKHDFDYQKAMHRIQDNKIAGPEYEACRKAADAGTLTWGALMGEVQKHVSLINSAALAKQNVDSDDWRVIAAGLKALVAPPTEKA